MPRAARPASGKAKGAGRKPAPEPPPEAQTMTVRMLYGERAGQAVQVTRAEAIELCGGWTPRAEPVAVRPSDQRETR